MTEHLWDEASVMYPDWKGTAQLDQRQTAAGLEEAVGLDSDKWMIVGFDLGGGESKHDMHVVAVDRSIVPDGGGVLPKIAEQHGGEVPVTDFLIHDVDPYEVLRAITHQFELRMRWGSAVGVPLRVVALGDVPEQGQPERG